MDLLPRKNWKNRNFILPRIACNKSNNNYDKTKSAIQRANVTSLRNKFIRANGIVKNVYTFNADRIFREGAKEKYL